jgi:hypothetical protein
MKNTDVKVGYHYKCKFPDPKWSNMTVKVIRMVGGSFEVKSVIEGHFDIFSGAWLEPLPEETAGQAGGLKFDAGKLQWNLLLKGAGMIGALEGVVKVLMFGAKKYAAHSWREVEDGERRYLDGLMRHYAAIMRDGIEARDEESGELHIDHLNCNGLFLGELARCKTTTKPE